SIIDSGDFMALTFERILSMIKNGGYKLTPQRKIILDVIMKNTEHHLTIEEIFDEVKKNSPKIGIATVYRTVQMLEELGVVIKHHFDEGTSRYELADSNRKHDHHHLVCLDCGKVIDIQD